MRTSDVVRGFSKDLEGSAALCSAEIWELGLSAAQEPIGSICRNGAAKCQRKTPRQKPKAYGLSLEGGHSPLTLLLAQHF